MDEITKEKIKLLKKVSEDIIRGVYLSVSDNDTITYQTTDTDVIIGKAIELYKKKVMCAINLEINNLLGIKLLKETV